MNHKVNKYTGLITPINYINTVVAVAILERNKHPRLDKEAVNIIKTYLPKYFHLVSINSEKNTKYHFVFNYNKEFIEEFSRSLNIKMASIKY